MRGATPRWATAQAASVHPNDRNCVARANTKGRPTSDCHKGNTPIQSAKGCGHKMAAKPVGKGNGSARLAHERGVAIIHDRSHLGQLFPLRQWGPIHAPHLGHGHPKDHLTQPSTCPIQELL